MRMFDALELEEDADGHWVNGGKPSLVTGFSFDSRNLKPGEIFLALKTENRDGHDYLNSAFSNGASGAIVERANLEVPLPQLEVANTLEAFQRIARIHRERFQGLTLGITGSCGKTTTKDLLSHLLGKEETHSTFLNLNNLLGVPLTLMGLDNDRHKYGVIEAGTNMPGEMECLASMIKPDISIITNIYPVHLEQLGTLENIAHQKSFLAQATKEGGYVLLPSACMRYGSFQSLGEKAWILVREGENVNFPGSQIIFYNISKSDDNRVLVSIKLPDGKAREIFILPILSEGVLSNAALAICACLLIGIEREQIARCLNTWVPSEHRGQIYYLGKQVYYADCYNANPASMADALSIFQSHFDCSHNRLYILGSMTELGENAPQYHYDIGKSLKLSSQDRILLLGKSANDYELGLKAAGNDFSQIICLQNKEKAFDYLNGFEGAVFLKGSKPYALWELLPSEAQLEESSKEVVC